MSVVPESEFSRMVRHRPLPAEPIVLEPTAQERIALAERFGLPSIETLRATVTLDDDGKAIKAKGHLSAAVHQACAVSGEPFPVTIEEPLSLRFVQPSPVIHDPDTEIELTREELDEIEYSGDSFDLGEAVAQSLELAMDPYAEGPNADAMRDKANIESDENRAPSGPLAEALAALKKD